MSQLLYVLALLACPVGMGLMMWMMMGRSKPAPVDEVAAKQAELARLRTEIDQLRTGRAEAGSEHTAATAAP
ncbi:hypothetical protein E4P39_01760 [Blastococcus sp. CT_GayMR19]|uniref:hypothetical protein n=1 Tax=Blastococcus sp. CT_GayMR19 TaxID=2559608 RepID=UPI001073775A|nr:hypothetical protein [Blastococcus sp. CT_GayMR19]TFV79392.1 hypothetical protein E4P39_01760 [Blastococcus sp. CT_GayMR19]